MKLYKKAVAKKRLLLIFKKPVAFAAGLELVSGLEPLTC